MKRMIFLGALVLGVTVCSQSFGFELMNRMLGHRGCASCCEPGCDAGNGCAAEPGCGAGNGCAAEPACGAGNGCAAEPACGAGNGCAAEPACGAASCCGLRKKHDLFGGLKGLFEKLKRKHKGCCDSCCEPACGADNGCAAEPACGAASCCGVRKKCTPIRDLLKSLKSLKKCRKSCCDSCCGEPDCSAGCTEPACGAGNGCCPAAAPTPDASASKKVDSKVVAVSLAK